MKPLKKSEKETLKSKLRQLVFVDFNGCWIWTGLLNPRGYGQLDVQGVHGAHRVFYTLFKGPIAKRMTLDHLCHVTYCVNPDHLEQVTFSENSRRAKQWCVTRKRLLNDKEEL